MNGFEWKNVKKKVTKLWMVETIVAMTTSLAALRPWMMPKAALFQEALHG